MLVIKNNELGQFSGTTVIWSKKMVYYCEIHRYLHKYVVRLTWSVLNFNC